MIRIPQVRVVDEEGAQLGVMPTPRALEMAQERGLDLVEVAPMASPPVVKFLDFGQYKYDLTKREKEAKRKQRSVTFKEVRLSPKIGVGDFDTKVHRAIEFLEDGDRIKVTVRFRGRELTHPELGRNLLAKFVGSGQGARRRGADAAPRRQVDAHHDGIAAQAEGARRSPPAAAPTGTAGPTRPTIDRTERDRHRRGTDKRSSTPSPTTEVPAQPRRPSRPRRRPSRHPHRLRPQRRPRHRSRRPGSRIEEDQREHAGPGAGDVRRVRPRCPR